MTTFLINHWALVGISVLWAVQTATFIKTGNTGQALLAGGILISNAGIMVTAARFHG